jgi:hypothetical protein
MNRSDLAFDRSHRPLHGRLDFFGGSGPALLTKATAGMLALEMFAS